MYNQLNTLTTVTSKVLCKVMISNTIPKSGTNIRECNIKKNYLLSISKRKIKKLLESEMFRESVLNRSQPKKPLFLKKDEEINRNRASITCKTWYFILGLD